MIRARRSAPLAAADDDSFHASIYRAFRHCIILLPFLHFAIWRSGFNTGLEWLSDGSRHAAALCCSLSPRTGQTMARHRYFYATAQRRTALAHNYKPRAHIHIGRARCLGTTPVTKSFLFDLTRAGLRSLFTFTICTSPLFILGFLYCSLTGDTGATVRCHGATAGIGSAGARPMPTSAHISSAIS
jgi:hypothetical protein